MQNNLAKFLVRLVQSLLVLVRQEERESSLLSLNLLMVNVRIVVKNCDVS